MKFFTLIAALATVSSMRMTTLETEQHGAHHAHGMMGMMSNDQKQIIHKVLHTFGGVKGIKADAKTFNVDLGSDLASVGGLPALEAAAKVEEAKLSKDFGADIAALGGVKGIKAALKADMTSVVG